MSESPIFLKFLFYSNKARGGQGQKKVKCACSDCINTYPFGIPKWCSRVTAWRHSRILKRDSESEKSKAVATQDKAAIIDDGDFDNTNMQLDTPQAETISLGTQSSGHRSTSHVLLGAQVGAANQTDLAQSTLLTQRTTQVSIHWITIQTLVLTTL